MIDFTDEDIFRLDERFAQEGIPFHARPSHAAREILGPNYIVSGIYINPQIKEITEAYARLIPEVKFTWPGMGTGLAASLDRVKKVTISVIFGSPHLAVYEGLGFSSNQEWAIWCRGDQKIANKSILAFADMYDLVYGINSSISLENAKVFWGLAANQLKLVAESLSQSGSISSAVLQPIFLIAELSLKGTLLHLGVTEKDLKNSKLFGHDLIKLGQKMVEEYDHRDNLILMEALKFFPDYVGERYRETELTRLEVIGLALNAQFIAASAVRRVSGVDLALQVENDLGPRSKF